MSKKRRTPSPEELQLWRRVVDNATPLSGKAQGFSPHEILKPPDCGPVSSQTQKPIEAFNIGSRRRAETSGVSLSPTIVDQLSRQPVQMDQKAFGKLTKGKLEPEARIDLHGMTLDRAHFALNGFILRASASGQRLVLVITGKGKSRGDTGIIPERRGVLRHHVPDWLRSAPLRQLVMQVSPAHIKHGGTGAYYVYLRRNR